MSELRRVGFELSDHRLIMPKACIRSLCHFGAACYTFSAWMCLYICVTLSRNKPKPLKTLKMSADISYCLGCNTTHLDTPSKTLSSSLNVFSPTLNIQYDLLNLSQSDSLPFISTTNTCLPSESQYFCLSLLLLLSKSLNLYHFLLLCPSPPSYHKLLCRP